MDAHVNKATNETPANSAAAKAAGDPNQAQFVGSIPQAYDEHLGPLLFEFSAIDLAKKIADELDGPDPVGRVLEIASGTGEHGAHITAMATDLIWTYSDIDPVSQASQRAWRGAADHDRLRGPLTLDTTQSVWSEEEDGGFSQAKPWLPIDPKHKDYSVQTQESNPDSLLHAMRKLLKWRQSVPALVKGTMKMIEIEHLLCWIREYQGQKVLVLLNISAQTHSTALPVKIRSALSGHGFTAQVTNSLVTLPPFQAFFALVE